MSINNVQISNRKGSAMYLLRDGKTGPGQTVTFHSVKLDYFRYVRRLFRSRSVLLVWNFHLILTN